MLISNVDKREAGVICLFKASGLRLGDFFLEIKNGFVDVLGRDQLQCDIKRLFANVHVGRGQRSQDVHQQWLKRFLVPSQSTGCQQIVVTQSMK